MYTCTAFSRSFRLIYSVKEWHCFRFPAPKITAEQLKFGASVEPGKVSIVLAFPSTSQVASLSPLMRGHDTGVLRGGTNKIGSEMS